MTIVNSQALVNANTSYEAKGAEIFGGSSESVYRRFCDVRQIKGLSYTLTGVSSFGKVEEIVGSRQYDSLRAYSNAVPVKRFGPKALRLPIMQVTQDLTGDVERTLNDYLTQNQSFFESPVNSFLLSNPKCIDGGALVSASHPYGEDGATWSNITATALDATVFAAGVSAMRGFKYENGKNAGRKPTALMVGSSNRKMAFDLCGSPLLATATGSTVPNWIQQGEIEVIINDDFTTEWLLLDLSPGRGRPIVVAETMAPQATAATGPDSQAMIDRSEAVYLIEAWAALAGADPYSVYGKIAA